MFVRAKSTLLLWTHVVRRVHSHDFFVFGKTGARVVVFRCALFVIDFFSLSCACLKLHVS